MSDLFIYAIIGGIGVALATGPLGCFIVWRRMAFFGDTVAHGALLGVALGFLFEIDLTLSVIAITALLALVLAGLQARTRIATDTLLGILAHSMLAFGLIAAAMLDNVQIDLMGYLFGDILAITGRDLLWIYGGGAAVLALLIWFWRPLLAAAVDEDLAAAEGAPVTKLRTGLMLLTALVIAIAMKITGILLITAMLIIPAATARLISRSPEQMAVLSSITGIAGIMAGLGGAFRMDTPAGPSIVAALALFFAAVFMLQTIRGR